MACGCTSRQTRKVLPEPGADHDDDIYASIEVRANRYLRVIRVNDSSSNGAPSRQTPEKCSIISSGKINEFEESTITTATSSNKDTVIYFLHGVGGCADVWRGQIAYFSNLGYDIVAPDLIGHGLSMAPDDKDAYTFEEIFDDMLAMFDKFSKKTNILVGHSYGTAFVTKLAEMRPLLVKKLILISGGGPTALAPQPGIFTLPICLLSCVQPVMVCGFMRSAFHKKTKDIPMSKAFDVPTYVLSHIMRGQNWLEGDEEYHKLISTSTLLIYGNKDPLVTLEDELEMEDTLPEAKLEVIQNASHMVMIEYPEKVSELIHRFITDRESTRRTLSQDSIQLSPRHRRPSSSARSRKRIPAPGSLIRGSLTM
ncbi:protein ABHD8-like [Tubulanus polymorphus]|uniref:protein ABHD8-like n=1 Tax=Tubulanus polymorphus TaxID=672921 RepID=UPI003DA27276